MNDTFFLGPLIVPARLLLFVVAGVAGYWALRLRLYRDGATEDKRRLVLDPLGQVLFVGMMIWKFSPLILDTRFILENPLSLLYFSGGNTGFLLAAVYALIALGHRTWKSGLPVLIFPDAVLTLLLAGGGVYALMLLVLLHGGIFAALAAAAGFGLYGIQLKTGEPLGSHKAGNLLTVAIVIGLVGVVVENNLQTNRNTLAVDPADSGIRVGVLAADFTLTSLDGSPITLSDYRGKKVLLNFWATWCPPCKAEMPHVEKFYKEMFDQGVVVLGINLTDTEKSSAHVESFVSKHELSFPIVLDEAGQVRDLYRVRAYPTSIIIDSRGQIRSKHQGGMSYDSLRSAFSGIE